MLGWTRIRYHLPVVLPTEVAAPSPPLAARLVRQARAASRLSQRELARRASVSRSTVDDIEAGRRDPSLGTLRAVLRAAGLDLDLRLLSIDPHDDVLRATIDALDPERRAELHGNLDAFVRDLAAGLGASKPLRRPRERRAG